MTVTPTTSMVVTKPVSGNLEDVLSKPRACVQQPEMRLNWVLKASSPETMCHHCDGVDGENVPSRSVVAHYLPSVKGAQLARWTAQLEVGHGMSDQKSRGCARDRSKRVA